jgi:hypothetical protein
VLADPNSAQATTPTAPQEPQQALTQEELYQLTLYKWRYSLEAYGFERHEVRELMFLKWLHASRRVAP